MSNKINRTKTGTSVQVKGLGKRGIAIVLCFVMLLTALGTGSLLSTAAVSQSDDSNASEIAMDAASALVKAAANGAEAVTASEADEEPFIDDIEDGYSIKASDDSEADHTKAESESSENDADKEYKFVREEDDIAETGWNWDNMASGKIWIDSDYNGNYNSTGGTYDCAWENGDGVTKYLCLKANYTYHFNCIITFNNNGGSTTYGKPSSSSHYFSGTESSYDEPASSNKTNFELRTLSSDSGYVSVQIKMFKQYANKASVRVYQIATDDKYVYGCPQAQSSWNTSNTSTLTKDSSTGYFYYDVSNKTNTIYFRIKFAFHYYYAGDSDVELSTSSSKKTANDNGGSDAGEGAFKITSPNNRNLRIWIDVSGINVEFGGTLKVWYEEQTFSIWGGQGKQLDETDHLLNLTYNPTKSASSGAAMYDGSYTFTSTNWYSMMPSTGNGTFGRVWNSYNDVAWSLDTYNDAELVKNKSSYYKVEMSSGAFQYIEITDQSSSSWGIKLAAVKPNTTVNISYDATNKYLYLYGAESNAVTVYAKDGAIRGSSKTYADIADTKIYKSNGSSTAGTKVVSSGNQTYETYVAEKGETIVIKTTIGATDSSTTGVSGYSGFRSKYYVRGFCINGEVPTLLSHNSNGVYTQTYKIPEDYEDSAIEITPIYYLANTTTYPVVTFRVEDFTDNLKQVGSGKPNWGDTLYAYPFYGKLGGYNNAFGAYPGQPLVYNNGQYQIQIPVKSTAWAYDSESTYGDASSLSDVNNKNVSGVTMSNGYYDTVHKSIMGYGDNSASADHVQTYDYGDFYKIFNEKSPVDNIVYQFKYETAKNNGTTVKNQNSYTAATLESTYGTGGNGFEQLKNFHGRAVDLFGTPLSGDAADPTKTPPVYVVSIGGPDASSKGVENIAGYFATEWVVFGTSATTVSTSNSYSRVTNSKTSIPPEILVLNNDTSSFNTTTYPSAVSGKSINDWKALYTTLKNNYAGKPVKIAYEKAKVQLGSENYATSGSGGATRNDGRWLYSKNGESITSTIKIQYSDNNGSTWVDNSTTPKNGLSAYFTNTDVYGGTSYSTTIDPDKTFNFEAKTTNANYKFVGWYFDSGVKITSDNVGSTERSGSYTLVAKFMQVTEGQLTLSHSADTGTVSGTNYQGSGTTTIAVTVKDGDSNVVYTRAADTSDVNLGSRYISSDKGAYTIEVTLTATPSGEDTFGTMTCSGTSTFFGGSNSTSGGVTTRTFSFNVSDLYTSGTTTQSVKQLLYHSYFYKVAYEYKYTFSFTARDRTTKNYVREGSLSAAQISTYVTGSGTSKSLTDAFLNNLAPKESNFKQTITWSYTTDQKQFTYDSTANKYSVTKTITATASSDYSQTVVFDLPYAHTDGVATETSGKVVEGTSENLTVPASFGVIPMVNDDYITAPAKLYTDSSDTTGKFFQYWSIKRTSDDKEVSRCYFNKFNLVAMDNYTVEPIYGATYVTINESGTRTNITYLETSRNQYNGTGADAVQTAYSTAADLLYNDFAVTYNYNGSEIRKNDASSADITDLGIVIERVQKLSLKQDGTPYTDPSTYTNLTENTATIENVINGGTATGVTKHQLAKTALDNKNRIELYDMFYNSSGWSNANQAPAKTYGYKNYVYRAYSYMIVSGSIVLSDTVYFTMYDKAV